MKLWPVAYLTLPLLNVLARTGLEVNDASTGLEELKPAYAAAVWVGIGVCLATTRVANLAFSCVIILCIILCIYYSLTDNPVNNKVEHGSCQGYLSYSPGSWCR